MTEVDTILLKWVMLRGKENETDGGLFTIGELAKLDNSKYIKVAGIKIAGKVGGELKYRWGVSKKGLERLEQLAEENKHGL